MGKLKHSRNSQNGCDAGPIDFVIMWVDGSDPDWQEQRKIYAKREGKVEDSESNCESRYRDWGLLPYWFRGIERFAPWVNKVYFVTCGHIPSWLKTDNKKLVVVKHSDFMPSDFLPTFSSHAIELNLYRIAGLSERFVYFNDDMFLTKPAAPSDFFDGDRPKDIAALNVHCYDLDKPIQLIATRDCGVVNSHFDEKKSIKRNLAKWLYWGYGLELMRTILLMPWPRFPGFYMPHCPQSLTKQTCEEVWHAEPEILRQTCSHRFRADTDVNQWVFRCWQIAKGQFSPRSKSFSKSFFFQSNDKGKIVRNAVLAIQKQSFTSVCVNDAEMSQSEFETYKSSIQDAFKALLPNKCSFEKGV